MKKSKAVHWFLFGLGSQLQIIASLSFTEVFVFLAAPLLFMSEWPYLKRNGIAVFFSLSIAVVIGCVVASIANHTSLAFVLRGMAVATLMPCSIVVGHWMLRRDMSGFKFMLIGAAVSSVLSTFWFQRSVEVDMLASGASGASAVAAIMSGPLYWISRISPFVMAIPQGWYLSCPLAVSAAAPLFTAGLSLFLSTSGRAAALSGLAAMILVVVGGKTGLRIRNRLCRNFWLLLICGIVGVFLVKSAYSFGAEKGLLGHEAKVKYEMQTKGDKSLKALLLGGRMESFCGLIACVDNPIVGFGPWALDEGGYVEEFLSRYATLEDYLDYLRQLDYYRKTGMSKINLIPCHAYITEFWLWYGISGLLFWLYVIFVLLRYLRQDCWAVPQWYMWLAASIPGYAWGIFFSPWANRVNGIMFIVACLMVRAVRMGRQQIPVDMVR